MVYDVKSATFIWQWWVFEEIQENNAVWLAL
jgi:hypothetical protein